MRTTRTRSPYLSPKNARAPALMASSNPISVVVTSAFSRMWALTSSSMRASAASSIGDGWLKSKRKRSGATIEPAWRTCSPSTRRSTPCRMWVTE
jgi:hypothetical protein